MKGHYYLGYISRTHGQGGSVLIKLDTDQPERYHAIKNLFIEREGMPFPLFIEAVKPLNQSVIRATLKRCDHSRTAARELVGQAVYLPLSSLPPLSGKQFYYHEILGFEALSQGEILGEIKAVKEQRTAQDLFVIDHQGRELLVPIIDEFISKIDREKREIHLTLPEGLLDLYL